MAYKDKKGYKKYGKKSLDWIHRNRAFHHIYLKNRGKYPLSYQAYEVHHIDWDKTNNRMNNLALLTPEEHDMEHDVMVDFGMNKDDFYETIDKLSETFSMDRNKIVKLFYEKWEEFEDNLEDDDEEKEILVDFLVFKKRELYPEYQKLKREIWKELKEELQEEIQEKIAEKEKVIAKEKKVIAKEKRKKKRKEQFKKLKEKLFDRKKK